MGSIMTVTKEDLNRGWACAITYKDDNPMPPKNWHWVFVFVKTASERKPTVLWDPKRFRELDALDPTDGEEFLAFHNADSGFWLRPV